MSTNSSERVVAARKALLLLDTEVRISKFYYEHAEQMASREGYTDPSGEGYDLGALVHNVGRFNEALVIGADALRALIDPTQGLES